MNTILIYLDNMFLNLPDTTEVRRAKEELAAMMEDKYSELMAEGKKENEAVGIVISEFGNLEELASVLGLENVMEQHVIVNEKIRSITREEAEEYLSVSKATSKWIGIGVFLCICSPLLLFIVGGIDNEIRHLTDIYMVCFGIVPLFILVSIAVAIFIFNGIKIEKFGYLKNEELQIDKSLSNYLIELEEKEKPKFALRMVIATVMCIFSVIPLLIGGTVTDNEMIHTLNLCFMFILVGIAVMIFINSGNRMECIKVLRQEGEFTKAGKKGNKMVDTIAGIYWPVAAAIYLIWSFLTMDWVFTWIVWPVAGVTFAVIAAICNTIQKEMS